MKSEKFTVAVLAGDGIGPEITAQALKALEAAGRRFGVTFAFDERPVGGAAYDLVHDALPDETLAAAKSADAVLLGAVGGPKWDFLAPELRPERRALLTLRAELGLFANIRPVKMWPGLEDASPLKGEVVARGVDMVIVRELTGGVYFGRHVLSEDGARACDEMAYSKDEIDRISRVAFALARKRSGRVTSVDKANVLATSRLWRETVGRIAREDFPDVSLEHMYVDNAAMQLMRAPSEFDVILTENMFGDILSDEASQTTGSIGMLPSASLGAGGFGMYEPIHGSAPDIAGKGVANPVATILSAAMMLRISFGLPEAAAAVEQAVGSVLSERIGTPDVAREGWTRVSTDRLGDEIASRI